MGSAPRPLTRAVSSAEVNVHRAVYTLLCGIRVSTTTAKRPAKGFLRFHAAALIKRLEQKYDDTQRRSAEAFSDRKKVNIYSS